MFLEIQQRPIVKSSGASENPKWFNQQIPNKQPYTLCLKRQRVHQLGLWELRARVLVLRGAGLLFVTQPALLT